MEPSLAKGSWELCSPRGGYRFALDHFLAQEGTRVDFQIDAEVMKQLLQSTAQRDSIAAFAPTRLPGVIVVVFFCGKAPGRIV